jgi:hypothetical protein
VARSPKWSHQQDSLHRGSNGRLRKDKRPTCKKLGSGVLEALVETHHSLDHLQ